MSEPVSTLKTIVGTFTAAVVAPATADALRAAERMILGVPQSVLLAAIAGALIGVLLLPEKDADRVFQSDSMMVHAVNLSPGAPADIGLIASGVAAFLVLHVTGF